jgi:hypothetical protein
MPLLEMEAAVEAGNSDDSVVIDNVPVTFVKQSALSSVQYRFVCVCECLGVDGAEMEVL